MGFLLIYLNIELCLMQFMGMGNRLHTSVVTLFQTSFLALLYLRESLSSCCNVLLLLTGCRIKERIL
jgi:hypothetical protein